MNITKDFEKYAMSDHGVSSLNMHYFKNQQIMPKNVITTDAVNLASVPLPNHGSSYTVVSHKFIIDETLAQLALSGFVIKDEEEVNVFNGTIGIGGILDITIKVKDTIENGEVTYYLDY